MRDLTALSATVLGQSIARGDVSSLEAVEAHIARIEQVNPRLNAVVVKRYDEARDEARRADTARLRGESAGPLQGVPMTVKESLELAGTPSTFGLPARAGVLAAHDDVHVARLRAAGAIVIGKTNVSQCLAYTEADNPLYGRTRNPRDPSRTPGGSSGGEGAIIAAGGSPLGIGTDIGGSVRVPAAFCGIASFKPTTGRMDDPGAFSFSPGQRAIVSQCGVLARTVNDVALGYRIAAQAIGSPFVPVDPASLRVRFYTDDGTFTPSPAVRRGVREAAAALRTAGAQVEEWTPPGVREAFHLFGGLLTADRGAHLRRVLAGGPRTPQLRQLLAVASMPAGMVPALRALLRLLGQHGLAFNLGAFGAGTADRYWQLVQAQRRYQAQFAEALGDADIILAPAASLPAFLHGATRDLLTAGAYAPLYNLLGWPAGVVPVTQVRPGEESDRPASRDLLQKLARRVEHGSAGMPVAVQVVARPWQEHVALAAMAVVEAAATDAPPTPCKVAA
ncbi:MAG TPA: amidase family protein [Candidatus Binatia bacterium]|nr:amidase family protein [Candidatus Binatia bacterium]